MPASSRPRRPERRAKNSLMIRVRTLHRASFGFLLRHPWQLALAVLGIVIGVAVMVAIDLANASAERAFRLSMDTVNGRATHQLVGGPAGVPETVYQTLRVEHGLRSLAPVVTGEAVFAGTAVSLLGVDVFAESGFRDYTAVVGTAGQAERGTGATISTIAALLTRPDAVLLSPSAAENAGLAIGDEFELDVDGNTRTAVVVGFLGSGDDAALQNLIVADIATAQAWLRRSGYLSRIDARLEDEASVDRLRSLLPSGVALLTAESRTQQSTAITSAFMTNLTAMSLLAMLVGMFLIYNSVSFAVVQRRGLIGVLRALGLTEVEAFRLILYEGLVLGLVGSALGLLVGVWLGEQLIALVAQSINDLYFRVTVTDVSAEPMSLARGGLAGLGATLIAAVVPAIEASRYRPSLAIRRSSIEARTGRALPRLLALGVATMLAAGVLLMLSETSLVGGLTALFMLILGIAVCVPIGVALLLKPLALLASALGGATSRMAVEGIAQSLSRTGVAIVALAVAVSATIGVSLMVGSFRLAVSDWVNNTLQSDIYVGVPSGSLSPEAVSALTAVPGIAEYSTSRRAWIEAETGRTRIAALSMVSGSYAGTELVAGDAERVWPAFDRGDGVIVSEPYAYQQDVRMGDEVVLLTNNGERGFAILGVYRSYEANQGTVLISRAAYDLHWSDRGVDSLGLYLAPGADTDAVADELREVGKRYQAIRVARNAALRDVSLQVFDRTFIITNVLYWLAVMVAVIGILGAMLALQLERSRELAILRAVGMTPGQLGGMVTFQSGLIGLLAGLASVPLGLVMAWVLIHVINRRSFGWEMDLTLDASALGTALWLATGAALVAGVIPAIKASASSPAAAMREE